MRAHGGHWLDYDSIALAVLLTGISIVVLLALSLQRSGTQRRDRVSRSRRGIGSIMVLALFSIGQ